MYDCGLHYVLSFSLSFFILVHTDDMCYFTRLSYPRMTIHKLQTQNCSARIERVTFVLNMVSLVLIRGESWDNVKINFALHRNHNVQLAMSNMC